ncbi:MAG: terpene cyclase/mutase family protein [Planctomycetota bacterium]|nr:terpene cyclase/mutase family protein [Planctomycetota bacterium]
MRRLCIGILWAGLLAMPDLAAADAGAVKSAADRGANWLIEQHDLKTGTYGNSEIARQPGVVGMVLIALQSHHRRYSEPLGPFVSEPVKYLLKQQQEDGSIKLKDGGFDTYNTSLALQALAATRNEKYADAISKAASYLRTAKAKDGGFTYGYGFRHGGDLSNTWFSLCALRAAGEPSKAFEDTLVFLRRVQDNPETNPDLEARGGPASGGAYYQPGKSEAGTVKVREGREYPKPYGSMSAAALESFLHCGLTAEAAEVKAALRWFGQHYSAAENPGIGQAGYYYYAYAAARALHALGAAELPAGEGAKAHWAASMAGQLLSKQHRDGYWVNEEQKWMEGDKVLCSAYALAALNLCYKELKALK